MVDPPMYRVVVLGAAKHDYMPLAMAQHSRFEIVVVADDADAPAWAHERGEALAQKLGVPYVRDVLQAIRGFGATVACVTPEVRRHSVMSARAADAGLHVWQDKPMATTVEDCDRVVKAVERSGVRFLLYSRNSTDSLRQARKLLDGTSIGDLRAVHVDFFFAKDAGVLKGSGQPEVVPDSWMADGELAVEGIYPLAYVRALAQANVRQVYARTTAHFFQRYVDLGIEDLGTLSLELDGGVLATVCVGRIGRPSHPNLGEIRIHVVGTDGALVMAEPRPEIAVHTRTQTSDDRRSRPIGSDSNWRMLEEFAHAIDTDGPTALEAAAGRNICATVIAARESAQRASPVPVS